ncbi:MAG: ArsR/SmtB family transcription factor [Candidatus Eiseniibacteriota bacterium]
MATRRPLRPIEHARPPDGGRERGCPPDAMPALPPPDGDAGDRTLAALARAVGHPARVRLLRLLLARDTCVAGELAGEVPLAASTVSEHLRILKEAGLVKGEVDGPRRCYCVDRSVLGRLKALVEKL